MSSTMYQDMARSRSRDDHVTADHYRMVKALRAQRRAERQLAKANRASQRALAAVLRSA